MMSKITIFVDFYRECKSFLIYLLHFIDVTKYSSVNGYIHIRDMTMQYLEGTTGY